jgi:addiction module HigA family antidote
MPMYDPAHPGEMLREFMGDMTVSALAKHLGVTRANLSMLLNGRSGVSPLMSLKLDEAFGNSEGLWIRLQNQYDLAHARRIKRPKIKLLPIAIEHRKKQARAAKAELEKAA